MNTVLKNVVRTSVVGLGLLAASGAFAHDHGWGRQRWAAQYQNNGYGSGYGYGNDSEDYEYARVIDVDPIVRRVAVVTPQQECWQEQREVYGRPSSATPTILGAIIGGVVGHQFGSGGSRHAATAAGVLLGASVGHDTSMRDAPMQVRNVERCAVSERQDWEERIDGYRVRYVYRGREYCTTMPYDPGNRVRIRVGYDVDVVR